MADEAPDDFVDVLLASWAERRPDLNVAPIAVTTRLARIRDHFEGHSAALYGEYGLTGPSFVMLATITRLRGAAETVTEPDLAAALGMTPGSIRGRVDRLIGAGIATRAEDGAIGLTPQGRDLAEAAIPAHLARQAELLAPLDPEEQATLAGLLRRLLHSLES